MRQLERMGGSTACASVNAFRTTVQQCVHMHSSERCGLAGCWPMSWEFDELDLCGRRMGGGEREWKGQLVFNSGRRGKFLGDHSRVAD